MSDIPIAMRSGVGSVDTAVHGVSPRILVVGVGNTLRQDDGVGILLSRRLSALMGPRVTCLELGSLDVSLAETVSTFDRMAVVDALVGVDKGASHGLHLKPIRPAESGFGRRRAGFTSHLGSWGDILALAQQLYGNAPETVVLGIPAFNLGYGEELSPGCATLAEQALALLLDWAQSGLRPGVPASVHGTRA